MKVEEPSIADTIGVIQGVKGYYEKHHSVKVPQELVPTLVSLSERYITDRFLPDKAIDLLDEACACCNLRHPEITRWLNQKKKIEELEMCIRDRRHARPALRDDESRRGRG